MKHWGDLVRRMTSDRGNELHSLSLLVDTSRGRQVREDDRLEQVVELLRLRDRQKLGESRDGALSDRDTRMRQQWCEHGQWRGFQMRVGEVRRETDDQN